MERTFLCVFNFVSSGSSSALGPQLGTWLCLSTLNLLDPALCSTVYIHCVPLCRGGAGIEERKMGGENVSRCHSVHVGVKIIL